MIYTNTIDGLVNTKGEDISPLKSFLESAPSQEARFQVALSLVKENPKMLIHLIDRFELSNEQLYTLGKALVELNLGHLLFSAFPDFSLTEGQVLSLRRAVFARKMAS